MPVPTSVNARLNEKRFTESLGNGCVEARNELEIGNFVNRLNVAVVGGAVKGYE